MKHARETSATLSTRTECAGPPPRAVSRAILTFALATLSALMSLQQARAGSLETHLCVVNTTDVDIGKITVINVKDADWNGNSRPDKNFAGSTIPRRSSRCEREELNDDAKDATFTMELTFLDNTALAFEVKQTDAKTTHWRQVPAVGTAVEKLYIQQTAGAEANGYYIRSKVPPDNSSWMANLLRRRPEIRVDQLTMPGSHDAGMSIASKCTGRGSPDWAITQTVSVRAQLTAGARYFDLRPYYRKETVRILFVETATLYAAHYSPAGGCYGQNLGEILDQVADFLRNEGRGETVFLKVSHTQEHTPESHDIEDDVTKLFKTVFDSMLMTVNKSDKPQLATMPLKAMAGKAVAVFDVDDKGYSDQPEAGILPYGDCNTDHGAVCDKPKRYDWGLLVYDKYADKTKFNEMRDDQLGKMEKHGGYDNSFLFLLSWTLTGFPAVVLDIRALSARSNPQLPLYIAKMIQGSYHVNDAKNPQNLKPAMPQIVYYDFVDPWLNRLIIAIND